TKVRRRRPAEDPARAGAQAVRDTDRHAESERGSGQHPSHGPRTKRLPESDSVRNLAPSLPRRSRPPPERTHSIGRAGGPFKSKNGDTAGREFTKPAGALAGQTLENRERHSTESDHGPSHHSFGRRVPSQSTN